MAPRRGGGSKGGSSSGSSCTYCNRTLELYDYGNPAIAYAAAAVSFIEVLIIVVCMFIVLRKPWTQAAGTKDKLRYYFFQSAGVCGILFFTLVGVHYVLVAVETTTTYSYYIVLVFRYFGGIFFDLLILGVIWACLTDHRNTWLTAKKLKVLSIIHWVWWTILLALTITKLAYYIRFVSLLLSSGTSRSLTTYIPGIDTAYAVLGFVASIEIIILTVLFMVKKAYSSKSLTLFALIAVCFFVYNLVTLIYYVSYNYFDTASDSFTWAVNFLSVFLTIPIVIALALLSKQSFIDYHNPGQSKLDSSYDMNQQMHNPGFTAYKPATYAQPAPASNYSSTTYSSVPQSNQQFNEQQHQQYSGMPNQQYNSSYNPAYNPHESWRPSPEIQQPSTTARYYTGGPQYTQVPQSDVR